MSFNTFGHLFRVTTFGESHGPAIGCVVDGCPPNLRFTLEEVQAALDRRRPGQSRFTTQRREPDAVEVLSGTLPHPDGGLVTTGTPMVIVQIRNQLDRLVPVHRVEDLTTEGIGLERELAMVKVRGTGEARSEALRLAEAFRARVIDATRESFVFEITGKTDKIDQFAYLMEPLGLVEVARTGVVAISRGPQAL